MSAETEVKSVSFEADLSKDANANLVKDASLEDSLESGVETGSGMSGSASFGSDSLASLGEEATSPTGPTEEERQEWEREMRKIEEETTTLRLVLQAKVRRQADLRRKLGITPMDEIKADINTTLKAIQESDAYNKTAATLSVVSEKTNAAITSAVEAFKGSVNESTEDTGREKVGNTIFRDATGKISSAASYTSNYVSHTYETVKGNPSVQAVGASVNSTWNMLKARVVGNPQQQQQQPDFINEVVDKQPTSQ